MTTIKMYPNMVW